METVEWVLVVELLCLGGNFGAGLAGKQSRVFRQLRQELDGQ